MMAMVLGGATVVGVAIAVLVYRHQCLLKDRAQLMRDAIRHRDFMFKLGTKGLLFGERALQESLNDMGEEIKKLVARGEVESWERLTRVLTHEIMNATTPIQSIAQAYLNRPDMQGSPYEEGIRAIHDTCMGLATFVDGYRKLTCLQEPAPMDLDLGDFLNGVAALYPKVTWVVDVPPSVVVRADPALLRQVFINLVGNALEAEAKTLKVEWDEKIYISNDGHVIPDDVRKEIFIPFFTTKSTGSGIGLALSRQILVMQGWILTLADRARNGYNVTFVMEREK